MGHSPERARARSEVKMNLTFIVFCEFLKDELPLPSGCFKLAASVGGQVTAGALWRVYHDSQVGNGRSSTELH